MVDVKPDEISAILKQQLSGFSSTTELEEYGTVEQLPKLEGKKMIMMINPKKK